MTGHLSLSLLTASGDAAQARTCMALHASVSLLGKDAAQMHWEDGFNQVWQSWGRLESELVVCSLDDAH